MKKSIASEVEKASIPYQRITPDALFHFSKNIDTIITILKEGFKPSVSMEEIPSNPAEPLVMGVPMVSFCDIPISQIREHISKYGKFGIGMTKKWGIQKGLSPVLYVSKNSNVFGLIINIMVEFAKGARPNSKKKDGFDAAIHLMSYTKPYQGIAHRKSGDIPDVRFYDEREWRYVLGGIQLIPRNRIEEFLQIGVTERLTFELSEVKYLFVEKRSDVLDLIHKIMALEREGKNFNDILMLISRIITCEDLYEDF
ncbi:MAG: abortive infection system antitoxin AbiGi family protein [Candidatus Kapaibacterium sp.]